MNAMLSRICALLKSPRSEQQMAAAVVLADLAPRDAGVVKALAGSLDGAPRPLRLAILDALGAIGSSAAVPDLLPLLESGDDEVRDAVAAALSRIGPAAVKPITRQILDAPPAARRALLAVLSRVKTADSLKALVALVQSGHPDASREASAGLIALSHSMSRSELSKLRKSVEKILRTPADKAPDGALSAALMTIGAVGQPGSLTIVLRLIGLKYAEEVRRDALLAVSGVLKGGLIPSKVLGAILPLIQDGPSPALRSAALEVLNTVQLPASSQPILLKLLDNPDPAVRRFAARKLGEKGLSGMRATRRLIALLGGGDPSLRDAAAESLGKLPESATPLADELLKCDEVHRAWTIAHILKLHVAKLRKPAIRKTFDAAIKALVSDDRLWEPLLYVVRHRDPKTMYDWLMDQSARFKKSRKYAEAEACLKPLTRGDHFDSEARYALALAGIRAARSKGSATSSTAKETVDLFRQLVRDRSFPLVDRLKRERSHVENEDLYFLGFRLTEGSADEKEAGAELLKLVAARAGTTKLGRSAKSKLRSEGLAL